MKPQSSLVIGNAVIWAALMLALSLLMADTPNSDTMILLLVAGWFASQALFTDFRADARREWACLKRWVSRVN